MDARALHGLAAGQRWLLRQEQILEHLSDGKFRHALRTREIVPVRPRVYKPWGAPDSWELNLQAACWSYDAVASHRSAARVHGIGGVPAVRLEVTVSWPRQVRADGLKVHSSNLLLPEFTTEVGGIPVTTPARTCIDLTAVCSEEMVEKAWASADYHELVTAEDIQRVAIKMLARGRRRMTIVRRLLDAWVSGAGTDSELAAKVLRWIIQDGLPVPEVQVWVVANGQRFCLDLAWLVQKVCVEADGWSAHRNRLRFDRDRDKIPELELAGWLVLPVTSRMPREVVLDRIRRALAR